MRLLTSVLLLVCIHAVLSTSINYWRRSVDEGESDLTESEGGSDGSTTAEPILSSDSETEAPVPVGSEDSETEISEAPETTEHHATTEHPDSIEGSEVPETEGSEVSETEGSEVSEIGEAPGVPGYPGGSENPEAPEVPESSEAPEVAETPEAPEVPESSEAPEVSETPEAPEVPETAEGSGVPDSPEAPEVPEISEAPESSEAPEVPETPEASEVPETSEDSEVPETPEAPEVPETPEAPEVPETPETPEVPETPETPEVPETSEAPEVSEGPNEIPEAPEAPEDEGKLPGVTGALKPILAIYRIYMKLKEQYAIIINALQKYIKELVEEPFQKALVIKKVITFSLTLETVAKAINSETREQAITLPKSTGQIIIKVSGVIETLIYGIKDILDNVRALFNLDIFNDSYVKEIRHCVQLLKQKADDAIKASQIISQRVTSAFSRLYIALEKVINKISEKLKSYILG